MMAHTTSLCFAGFLVMILASRGQGMYLRKPGDDPEGTRKIRIDPPVLNVRKACLKKTMDGDTVEKRQCPTNYNCTRGPKEIVMNGDDLKVWFCEQVSNLQQETPEPLDKERPQGDGPKVTEPPVVDEVTTSVPEKPLPSWFRSACRVEEQYGAIIKKSGCEDGYVCSRSFQYYLLAQEYVKVSFCVQKRPKKILPSGLPDWLLCYIAQKYTGGSMTGELPWVNEDGTIPVLNC